MIILKRIWMHPEALADKPTNTVLAGSIGYSDVKLIKFHTIFTWILANTNFAKIHL
jgi:hypothetical protein